MEKLKHWSYIVTNFKQENVILRQSYNADNLNSELSDSTGPRTSKSNTEISNLRQTRMNYWILQRSKKKYK